MTGNDAIFSYTAIFSCTSSVYCSSRFNVCGTTTHILDAFHFKLLLFVCVFADSPAENRKFFDDTIVLYNAKASDSAVYQCEASNRHGTLLSNANIMVMSMYEL